MTMRHFFRGRRSRVAGSSEEGSALVELALSMPVLLIMLLGAAEFARLAYASIEVVNAAHAAAMYASSSHAALSDSGGITNAAGTDGANMTGSNAISVTSVSTACSCSDTSVSPTSCSGRFDVLQQPCGDDHRGDSANQNDVFSGDSDSGEWGAQLQSVWELDAGGVEPMKRTARHFVKRLAAAGKHSASGEEGGSLVEMALSCLILIPILFGIVQLSIGLYCYHYAADAAREATRWAIVRGANCTGLFGSGYCSPTSGNGSGATATDIAQYVKGLGYPYSSSVTTTTQWCCGWRDAGYMVELLHKSKRCARGKPGESDGVLCLSTDYSVSSRRTRSISAAFRA